MSNLARFAAFKPAGVLTIVSLTLLLSIWAGVDSYLAAQAPSDSLLGFSAQTQARLRELRQQRDSLRENLRGQQSQAQKLLGQEKGLLSLQGQLQQKIGEAQKDLKLPQLPAEYQAKKCRLQELQTQQQRTAQNLQQTQQQIQQLNLSMSTLQNQITQTQQQIAQSQGAGPAQMQQEALQAQQLAQQQTQMQAQRLAQEMARQNANNLLTARMTSPANPLNGFSNTIAQATATLPSGGTGGGGSGFSQITRTGPVLTGSIIMGNGAACGTFAPVDRNLLDPAGTITVSFTYNVSAIAGAGTLFTVRVSDRITGPTATNTGSVAPAGASTTGNLSVALTSGNQGAFITAGVDPQALCIQISGGPLTGAFTITSIVITFNTGASGGGGGTPLPVD